MRRIVILRSEAVSADAQSGRLEVPDQDVSPDAVLQRTPGVTFSSKQPVALRDYEPDGTTESPADGGVEYAVEVDFETEEAERLFLSTNSKIVAGCYSNPAIGKLATICPTGAVGDRAAVKARINIAPLHANGLKGQGVRLAIVDTGIDGGLVTVAGGLVAEGFPAPGTSPSDPHGTMIALDARLAAPEADLFDYPLLHEEGAGLKRLLFDAVTAFKALLAERARDTSSPMVVVNSWGVHDRREDAPPQSPSNYGSNPQHPFNVLVTKLVAAGADVLFAAGNCGGPCGFESCGPLNLGAGNGILGANAHPDVVTVGAVTVHGDALGYSSQGPGLMAGQKPDISAPSHFSSIGLGGTSADTGTSTACAVAAGAVAAIRSKPTASQVHPSVLKQRLIDHARQPNGTGPGWHAHTGHGVIDAARTADSL